MAYIADSRTKYLDNPALEFHETIGEHWAHAPRPSQLGVITWNQPESNAKIAPNFRIGENYNTVSPPRPAFELRSSATDSSNSIHPIRREYYHINTNLGQFREAKASPVATSPSTPASAVGHFEVAGQYGGRTPALASPSLPTPSTDRSTYLILTPDQGMHPAHQLLGTPEHWNKPISPSPHPSYLSETGLTPDLGGLRLNSYEEPAFRLAGPVKGFQHSSVLLSSNPDSENSQVTDLDPLDIGDTLADLGHFPGQVAGTGLVDCLDGDGYNIHIVPPHHNTAQSIPVVNFDDPTQWNPALLLSPLSALEALPMAPGEYHDLGDDNYVDSFNGIAIQPMNWSQSFLSQTVSPASSNHAPLHSSPQMFPHSDTAAQELSPGEGGPQHTRFRSLDKSDATSAARNALEAVRSGQSHRIVNPKGVSERTLAAAKANRKREAKFTCHVCGNSQTSKQNLDNHIMSRHMQMKRFECPVSGCLAKYGHARGVNRHLDSKHPGYRQSSGRGKRAKAE